MIRIHDVTKRYGPTVAVDRLSFEVREGEATDFLGPNGAGKSTTMRMVGLDAPSAGRRAPLRRPALPAAPRRCPARSPSDCPRREQAAPTTPLR
jgi:ABC-type branched-subunit amino acid transport system ATPase component